MWKNKKNKKRREEIMEDYPMNNRAIAVFFLQYIIMFSLLVLVAVYSALYCLLEEILKVCYSRINS